MTAVNISASQVLEEDIKAILKDIYSMYSAFESGDLSLLMNKAHYSIFELMGCRENYEKIAQIVTNRLIEQGTVFHSTTLGQPTKLYMAGDDKVYFIPRTSLWNCGEKSKEYWLYDCNFK